MKGEPWLERAHRSLKTARLALTDGDTGSAGNRAYYAMFYAARAALLFAGGERLAASKTHSGLISSFGQHLVKSGKLPTGLGRALSVESHRRQVSDYDGGDVSSESAKSSISSAEMFIATIEEWMSAAEPSEP